MTGTRVFKSWQSMKSRCNWIGGINSHNYKGRGISYCPEWEDFKNFYKDMGDRPEGLSLDRIDNDGNYCKENCRWASDKTQSRNTRRNIIYKGECAIVASNRLGGNASLVRNRVRYGWSKQKAFTTPVQVHKNGVPYKVTQKRK